MKYSTKTVDRRESEIKKKLTAAIAMLLVSCIMVVTSTYAWFTLSTAPEVTGIQTTIGGNGNLEIALGSTDNWPTGQVETITNGSTLSTYQKNVTWGNLVDLSKESGYDYGWDRMTLYPSALNIDASTGKVGQSFVDIPKYGPDGRVTALSNQVVSGIYSQGAFLTSGYGVRAIGASSSMTERQFDYKYALEGISNSQNTTKSKINSALQANGQSLGNIAVKYGLNANPTFTQDDLDGVGALLTATTSAVKTIEDGIVNYIKGIVASKASQTQYDDDMYNTVLDSIMNSLTYDKIDISTGTVKVLDYELNDPNLYQVISNYETKVKATLTQAKTAFDNIAKKDSYAWGDISSVLTYLMNVSSNNITVAGMTMDELKDDKSAAASAIIGKMTANEKIVVNLGEGSSVFYDIAVLVGSLSSRVDVTINYSGADISVTVYMESNISGDSKLTTGYKTVSALGSPEKMETTDDTSQIDDVYAYALDLFFRTNAENSNLLLQTNPAQRIYKDGTNTETLGNGSSMTFTSNGLAEDQMVSLMKAVKIVFISADAETNGNILAEAGLDVGTTKGADDTVTKNYVLEGDGSITADIRLFKTVTSDTGATSKVLITDDNEQQELLALTRNQAHKVTVLVYLDGHEVENSDVANGEISMTGKMNLQFASSATLVPMDYTELNQAKKEDN